MGEIGFLSRLYVWTLGVFLGIDGVWLLLVAKQFYAKHLGAMMNPKPNLVAAAIFYLIDVLGILVLVVLPNQGASVGKVAMLGALYGLVTYATYDLTNQATLKNWPVIVTVVDIAWGVFASCVVAVISVLLAKRLG